MPGTGGSDDTEAGSEEGNTPSVPDHPITFPEEPEVTSPAQSPTSEQSAIIEKILVNSIGNSAYSGNGALIVDAAEEYAKENPSKGDSDRLREVKDYTYGDVSISGWFTIPDGTFSTPSDIAPCDLVFSISSESGASKGKLEMSLEQETFIFTEDITDYIPEGENCVDKINSGFVYHNMDSTSFRIIMSAEFEDNGSHSIYYSQEAELLNQETGKADDEGALCILDEANIDYVLFGLDNAAPIPPDQMIIMQSR